MARTIGGACLSLLEMPPAGSDPPALGADVSNQDDIGRLEPPCPPSALIGQNGRIGKRGFWLIVTFIGTKMRQQTRPLKEPAQKVVQDIRRAARKHYSAEERSGSCSKVSVARTALPSCVAARDRAEPDYRWSKDFLEAERSAWLAIRLGPPPRTRSTIPSPRPWRSRRWSARLTLENRVLKKSVTGDGKAGE